MRAGARALAAPDSREVSLETDFIYKSGKK